MDVATHRTLYLDTNEALREFRKDMMRNALYSIDVQYTQEDKDYLIDMERDPIVYNIIFGKIQAFIGSEKANRVAARAEARESKDQATAAILNMIMEQDNEATDLDYQISLAARYAAIYRYGAIACTWENTSKYPEGQYVAKAIDPMDILFDYAPHEIDFDESNYLIYSRWFTADHIAYRYANGDEQLRKSILSNAERLEGPVEREKRHRRWIDQFSPSFDFGTVSDHDRALTTTTDSAYKFYSEFARASEGFYRVIEMHSKTRKVAEFFNDYRKGIKFKLPDGITREEKHKMLVIAGLGDQAITKEYHDLMEISVSAPDLSSEMLLDRPYSVQNCGYSIKLLPFYNILPDRRDLRSLVDTQIDMQDVVNRDLSTRAFFISKLLNPDWLVSRRAIDDETQLEALKDRKPGKIVYVNEPKGIEPIYPPLGAVGIFTQTSLQAVEQSEATSGVNKNMQAQQQTSDESGRLYQSRLSAAENMLSSVYQNVSRFIKQIEEFHLGVVQTHMRLPRMIRLLGPGGQKEANLMVNDYDPILDTIRNDVTVGKYDINIDTTKFSRTEKALRRDQLMQTMQMSPPEFNMLILPFFYKLLEIPEAEEIVKRAQRVLLKYEAKTELELKQMAVQAMQMEIQAAQMSQQMSQPQQLPPPTEQK